ncbi:hypothetical protein GDI3775 [Gluconacetobacter diazotrophicus PA1 5]|uniref:Uncharacterized protein n=1 Tax=Gluconacetobacter diazotrophicus (strain ATCC 49037 / DSM 5601 / CCUG 37298 / CIP 103539 / LMG 7603 / PAl5) TaxID=272568 RepID=A9H9J3_GLUDA|nr:hypothetical protein GDI3775 [Gluconacetobacter diazotrophicus PA1 5]
MNSFPHSGHKQHNLSRPSWGRFLPVRFQARQMGSRPSRNNSLMPASPLGRISRMVALVYVDITANRVAGYTPEGGTTLYDIAPR